MVTFLIVILLVGGSILFLIGYGRKGGSQLDQERYRRSWLTIERQLVRHQEASFHLVVLNADKLLDQALKQRGFKGETMGDRMKAAKQSWTSANNIWTAHKLRNRIAHETDVRIDYDTVRRALAAYKQALKDVGAI
ncbi:TPA: hypothetical protein DHU97_04095 [Candidatus Saccharibacteria bacterium]|nr:hypothetical protein [Candidatus Saccharibacteria bacterium]